MKTFFVAGVSNTIGGLTMSTGGDYPTSLTGGLPNISTLTSWNTVTTDTTFSNLTVKVKSNTRTADCSVNLVSTIGLNSLVTITASTSGYFTDSVNNDVITAGTIVRLEGTVAGTGTIALGGFSGVYNTTGSDYISYIGTLIAYSNSASTNYATFSGATNVPNSTESQHQLRIATAGTLRNLSLRVYSNSRSADDTIKVRLNGADTSISVVVPAAFTGVVQDLVNTQAVVAGDLVNWSIVAPTNTGSVGVITQIEFVSTKGLIGGTNTANPGFASGATGYLSITSAGANTFAQTDTDLYIPLAVTLDQFRIKINSNSSNYTSTVTLQKNGVDTAIQLVVPAGVTGWIEDTSSILDVSAGDNLNWKIVNGTGTGSVTFNSLIFDYIETAVASGGGSTYMLMGVG